MNVQAALKEIRKKKNRLTTQQMRTLKGQVLSGNVDGALRGLDKLILRSVANGTNSE